MEFLFKYFDEMGDKMNFLKIINLQSDDFRKLLIDLENKKFSNVLMIWKNAMIPKYLHAYSIFEPIRFCDFYFLNSIKTKVCKTIWRFFVHQNLWKINMILWMFFNFVYFGFFQVPERLYQLVDRSTDGLVTADQVMEFIAGLQAIRY